MRHKNLYSILEVDKNATGDEIKSSYRRLSFLCHPDKNIGDVSSEDRFKDISEAYSILSKSELKEEYDSKSKYGKNYNEYFELFDIDVNFTHEDGKDKLDQFKRNEINNIQVEIGESFDGKVEYERWVKCKSCDGSGKYISSKILIRDMDGNVIKTFEAEDGCDMCEGTGKSYNGSDCSFCVGKGKVGLNPCKSCGGKGRIMGNQKLKGIKLTGDETKLDSMGHYSKNGVGYLLLIKKFKMFVY